ncbi:MAG: energy transducer TonB [Burkholderiaceae bacterium]
MNARWSGWGLTAAVHGGLLAALVGAMSSPSSPSSPRASPATISARLLQSPSPSPSTVEAAAPVDRPLPRVAMAMPAATIVPPPEFQIQPTGAGAPPPAPAAALAADPPTAASPPSPAALQVATAVPAAAAAPADQPASLPADHRLCSERQTARQYPAMLRERGVQGLVLLRVKVDEDGRAAEVLIAAGSGWRLLDEAARRVAQSCPYLPARRGEQRLASWVEYPVRFALQSATFQ